MNSKYENMSFKEIINLLSKVEDENKELKNKITEISKNIELVGRQNKKLKRCNERYKERLEEILYKSKQKNCSTCKNNVEFPPPHTCDICTSLDQEEEYSMWEAK